MLVLAALTAGKLSCGKLSRLCTYPRYESFRDAAEVPLGKRDLLFRQSSPALILLFERIAMSARCDLSSRLLAARRSGRGRAQLMARVAAIGVLAFAALAGCRTANYTAKNLPEQFRVPPTPLSNDINLEQMAGAGVGTSQIGPGDLVEITIISGNGEERATPTPARVANDGTVMVPLIGGVPIGGLEAAAAEQRIAAAAVERGIYRQPYVTLTVKEGAVNRVTVLGAVAKPGVVALPRGSCDLASALAAAGGLTKEAGTRVEILHRGKQSFLAGEPQDETHIEPQGVQLAAHNATHPATLPFVAPAPLQQHPEMSRIDLAQEDAAVTESRKLEDRDVVMVLPERTQFIHVTGLVRKPDQFDLPRDRDIRVLDAIAMAGGTSSPVADKVFVIRQLPEMPEPAVIKLSITGAKRNGNENLRLAPGDLVSVESTLATMTVETASKFFRVGLGLSGNVAAF